MQVLSYPVAGASTPESARVLLLPDVLQLLQGGAGGSTPHARATAAREEKLRKKDADFQQLVADIANTPRPTETMIQAERGMLPGSQAARREQIETRTREHATQERSGFREALSQARTPGKETGAAAAEQPNAAAKSAATGATPSNKPVSLPAPESPTKPIATPAEGRSAASTPATPSATRATVALPANPTHSTTNVSTAAKEAATAAVAKVSAVSGAARTAAATTASASGAGNSASDAAPTVAPAAVEKIAAAQRRSAVAPAAETGASAEAELERTSDANVERIVRLLQSRIDKDRSVATLRLDPPELGTVRLHMDLRQDALALRVDTDNPAARDLLRDQMDTLRRSLESAGIRLEHVEVRGPESVQTGLDANAAQQQGTGSSPQHSATKQRDSQSAGRGPADRESPAIRGSASASLEETNSGPATESLVNVWA